MVLVEEEGAVVAVEMLELGVQGGCVAEVELGDGDVVEGDVEVAQAFGVEIGFELLKLVVVVDELDGLLETYGDDEADDDGRDVDEEVFPGVGGFVGRVDVEHGGDSSLRGPGAEWVWCLPMLRERVLEGKDFGGVRDLGRYGRPTHAPSAAHEWGCYAHGECWTRALP